MIGSDDRNRVVMPLLGWPALALDPHDDIIGAQYGGPPRCRRTVVIGSRPGGHLRLDAADIERGRETFAEARRALCALRDGGEIDAALEMRRAAHQRER